MAFDLVTGFRGEDHVTAAQWADLNRGLVGSAVILDVGSKMSVAIQTANQITVNDGIVMFDGREFYIEHGDGANIAIVSGTQGMMRNDIVYVEYTRDASTGVETGTLKVAEGTPVETNPVDPSITDMDIRTGVLLSQKKFCRVRIVGTSIVGVDMLVTVMDNLPTAMADIEQTLAKIKSGMTSLDRRTSKLILLGSGNAGKTIALNEAFNDYGTYVICAKPKSAEFPWAYTLATNGSNAGLNYFYSTSYYFAISASVTNGSVNFRESWSKGINNGADIPLSDIDVYVYGLK